MSREIYRVSHRIKAAEGISAKPDGVGAGESAIDLGRRVWIIDAHRDGKRFVVRADEKLTAFVELQKGRDAQNRWVMLSVASSMSPMWHLRRLRTW